MKQAKVEEIRLLLREYFRSRRVEKRGADGNPVVDKSGAPLWEERPSTVTGLAFALGFSAREEMLAVKNKKIKALIDRALLRIEEEAEEKLFSKDSFQGAKFFLCHNFKRWQEGEEERISDLGICSEWAE